MLRESPYAGESDEPDSEDDGGPGHLISLWHDARE